MSDLFSHKEIRKNLRQNILKQRRLITPEQAYAAGVSVLNELKKHPIFDNKVMAGS